MMSTESTLIRKRLIWDQIPMSLPGEVEPDQIPYHWHYLLFPILDFYGPAAVYAVGLKALGYPPTLVDLKEEVSIVEAALNGS